MKDFTTIKKALSRMIGQIERMSPSQHQKLSDEIAALGSKHLRALYAVLSPAIEAAEQNEERMATLEKERASKELLLKETVLNAVKNSDLSEILKQNGESSSPEELIMKLFNTKPKATGRRKTQKNPSKRPDTAPTTQTPGTTSSPGELRDETFSNSDSVTQNSQSSLQPNEYS